MENNQKELLRKKLDRIVYYDLSNAIYEFDILNDYLDYLMKSKEGDELEKKELERLISKNKETLKDLRKIYYSYSKDKGE